MVRASPHVRGQGLQALRSGAPRRPARCQASPPRRAFQHALPAGPGLPEQGDAAFQASIGHLTAHEAQCALFCCGVPVGEIARAASYGDIGLISLLAHCPGGHAAVAALLSAQGIFYSP